MTAMPPRKLWIVAVTAGVTSVGIIAAAGIFSASAWSTPHREITAGNGAMTALNPGLGPLPEQAVVTDEQFQSTIDNIVFIAILSVLGTAVPLLASGWLVWQDVGGEVLGEVLTDVHEMFGSLMLTAVGVHVAIIGIASLVRRRNLVRPMLTGRADAPGPDVVSANRRWLAIVVMAAALGVAAWSMTSASAS